MKKHLYIAYGSHLSDRKMTTLCPNAWAVAKSWLHDYQLAFRGDDPNNALATVIPAKGKSVPVVVWEISNDDENALDLAHGVADGIHTKKHITVEVAGKMKDVLVYIVNSEGYGVPSDSLLEAIVEGYNDFNLDTNILWDAVVQAHNESILKEV